jgi:peptidyl-prolyl cis-trans isomerase SurA
VYSAYVPPAPKKKAKVERVRYRETEHTFRQKSPQEAAAPAQAPAPVAAKPAVVKAGLFHKKEKSTAPATEKPGKKEKIRYGQKPREALPEAKNGTVEDAGALPEQASAASEPVNPLDAAAPTAKTRFSSRAKLPKQAKTGLQPDALTPSAPDSAEVADRETQNSPLGLAGDTATKKKKKATTDEGKTRLADKKKEPEADKPNQPQFTPAPQEPGAPAPAPQPKQ